MYALELFTTSKTALKCTWQLDKEEKLLLNVKNVNHVNFLWNQYFKTDLGLRVWTSINVLETNAGLSFYKTLLGSQEFYVFSEGIYYNSGVHDGLH